KFYDRAEIKDAMSYLTTIANPFDPISWSRMLGTPKRGVGSMAEAHLANFQEDHGLNFHEAMEQAEQIPALGPKIRTTVVQLADLLARATRMELGGGATDPPKDEAKPAPAADVLKLVLDETEMIVKLRAKRDPQDDARAANLEELIAVAREFD